MSSYSELTSGANDPVTEAVKCGASLALVQGLRDRNLNGMEIIKFSAMDFVYSKFVENQDKLLGIPLPKLSDIITDQVVTDTTAQDLTHTVNKYIYVVVFSYIFAYAGVIKNVSRKQLMEYAYAYALRALGGYTMGAADSATGGTS